jgi:hypothetical protein
MIRKLTNVAIFIAALTVVSFPSHATIWIVNGGELTAWFTVGVLPSTFHNIYEDGFGTSSEFSSPRVNGYNCIPLHTTHSSTMDDTNCSDQFGEGALAEVWGAPAVYSGMIDDGGTPGDFSNYTGSISWTGESGTAFYGGTYELLTSGVVSGTYDIATGIVSTSVASVTGNPGGVNCWNNPTMVDNFFANPCDNATGGSTLDPDHDYTISRRYLSGGVDAFNDNLDGTVTITLADFAYSSCVADPDCVPGSGTPDTFGTWNLNTTKLVPVPATIWLFGSALGLLGWHRRMAG